MMFGYQVVGTLTLHGVGIFGGVRLWVNRLAKSAWSADQAAELALIAACQAEDADPVMAMWGADLHVIPIAQAIFRLSPMPPESIKQQLANLRTHRPQRPRSGDVTDVLDYMEELEVYITQAEKLLVDARAAALATAT